MQDSSNKSVALRSPGFWERSSIVIEDSDENVNIIAGPMDYSEHIFLT